MTPIKKIRLLKWKHISFFLLLQPICLCLLAQVNITGKVSDSEGKGIPGISVSIVNTNFITATDITGMYSINANLRPGNYTLQFSGVGYKARSQALEIGRAASYTS